MSVELPTRALTLYQPWAWLVASGHKPIENRPPGFSHKSFRGDFWIHAGKPARFSDLEDEWMGAFAMCREILGDEFRLPKLDELSLGAIIGRASITGILPPRSVPAPLMSGGTPSLIFYRQTPEPWHFPEQYGFRVERASLLARPVPCRGYQGFWRVPAPVLQELSEAA